MIRVVTPIPDIEKQLMQVARQEIFAKLASIEGVITDKARRMFDATIRGTDIYESLLSSMGADNLKGHFGLTNPEAKVNQIIDFWTSKFETTFTYGNPMICTIELVYKDFRDVLMLPAAQQENAEGGGDTLVVLPWLEWLLLHKEPVVLDYFFLRSQGFGRSGQGYMAEKDGYTWSVPSQFAGDIEDNWITRLIDETEHFYHMIILTELKRVLS